MKVRCNVEGDLQLHTSLMPDGRQISRICLENIPQDVTDAVITLEWGLDGLKLDFIDEFYERIDTPKPNDAMDYVCLQVVLDKLLNETMEELNCSNLKIGYGKLNTEMI